MSLKKTTRKGHGTMTELNITPLLDLVFVLLVIFIITTPQLMNNLEMTLPSSKPPPPNPNKPKITRIEVAANGQITLNGAQVTGTELKEDLRQMKAENPDLPVVVKGSDEVEYQGMVVVLDTLQQLDITKVGLATQ
ncbi:MAG TPA: biopolymer transporter ExbD [Candidatus Acidoferrales bacterium]|nr:biopolymer transporter ExbD [Candidatus Acidoferrales bacterium]